MLGKRSSRSLFACLLIAMTASASSSLSAETLGPVSLECTGPCGELQDVVTFRVGMNSSEEGDFGKFGIVALFHEGGWSRLWYWVVNGRPWDAEEYGTVVHGPQPLDRTRGDNSIQFLRGCSVYDSFGGGLDPGYIVYVRNQNQIVYRKLATDGEMWWNSIYVSEAQVPGSPQHLLESSMAVEPDERSGAIAFVPEYMDSEGDSRRDRVNVVIFDPAADGAHVEQSSRMDPEYTHVSIPEIIWNADGGTYLLSYRAADEADWHILNFRVSSGGFIQGPPKLLHEGSVGGLWDPEKIRSFSAAKAENVDGNIALVTDKAFYWVNQDLWLVPSSDPFAPNPYVIDEPIAACQDSSFEPTLARTYAFGWRLGPMHLGGGYSLITGSREDRWPVNPAPFETLTFTDLFMARSCSSNGQLGGHRTLVAGGMTGAAHARFVIIKD